MAFKRTLALRLFNIFKISNPTLTNCRISSSPSAVEALIPPNPAKVAPDRGYGGIFRRFLQQRPLYQSAATAPVLRSLPTGEKLLEKLRGMDIARDRIRLDGLSPPATRLEPTEGKLTVEDARKVLRVSQLEMVKSKLRQIPTSSISSKEFVQICVEACSSTDKGLEFAKMLDELGTVIVLGNVVFLRPDQVVKAIQGLMPVPVAHPRRKEVEEMEKQKAAIDKKAETLVRRELWCGLGYLVVQTAAFMRLTFWELSWDVMEPICFYVTSMYFMAGYTFFLRTSKEPSFEGFFQSRFSTKQKRLMKIHNFDVGRYNELRKACFPHSSSPENALSFTPSFNPERTQFGGALH
uniref:Calcium uniporter protein C-terminal domain-containing protein n=1 Tax=Davidia involucrata TaxID=16924 RepID=A0A5B7A305_DAVIN